MYNPGVQDRSGELLARGISGASRAVGGGLERMLQDREKKKEEEKLRSREFKALQEYADASGIAAKDATTPMDLDSLKGLVRGKEAQRMMEIQRDQAAQKKKAGEMEMALLGEKLRGMEEARGRDQAYRSRVGAVMSGIDAEDPPPPLRPGLSDEEVNALVRDNPQLRQPMNAQRMEELMPKIAAAAAEFGAPDEGMQMVTQMLRERQAAPGPLQFEEDPVTGSRFARQKNTVLPSGTNPGKVQKPEEILGPDGEPTGMFAVRDRNGVKLVKGMSQAAQGKLDAGTIAQLQAAKAKALERIDTYRSNLKYASDPKNKAEAPDPSELEDARADLEQINGQLRGVGTGGGQKATKETKAEAAMPETRESVRQLFQEGKLTKAEALARLAKLKPGK